MGGVLLAGCGDEGSATTIEIGDGPGAGEELFLAMAEAQRAVGTYRMEAELNTGSRTMAMEGAAKFGDDLDDPRVSMTVSEPSLGDIELVGIDGVTYMSAEVMSDEITGVSSGSWVAIDPSDPLAAEMGGPIDYESSLNLQAYFYEHADVITIEESGRDTLDGVDVTEYVVTTDVSEAAELLGLPEGVSPDVLPFEEFSYSMWVDHELLVRQVAMEMGGESLNLRYYDFGEPVEIEAPADEDIIDLETLFGEG